MILLYLTLLVTGASSQSSVIIETLSHWAGGFQMQVEIPVTCELNGWRVHLEFSQDVDSIEVWAGDAVKGAQAHEFTIINKSYNGVLHVGQTLSFTLLGHGHGDIAPYAVASIEGCGSSSGSGGSGNTQAPWTTAIHTAGGGSSQKDYGDALKKSILFYYAQRSGRLPADNPISWRGNSGLSDCVVGGWYDAGDHVKFGLPFGSSTHLLLWGLRIFKNGYERAAQLDNSYHTVKWALDYMLNAWNPVTKELVIQIGDPNADHDFWGRPEDMTMNRPCTKARTGESGADIAGEWAAALALGSIVFKERGETAYATQLLTAAESLFAFAKTLNGAFGGATPFYASSGHRDEMCEGAVWLYKATNNVQYLSDARSYYDSAWAWAFSWDDKKVACQLLLFEATRDDNYKSGVVGFMQGWLPNGQVSYTPCGLAWRDKWGATRYAANTAFIALAAAELGINTATYRKWAVEQINYMLGDNNHDGGCFSFEIGYGSKYPLQPHHRGASCPDMPTPCGSDRLSASGPSPQTLNGGLVGGPDQSDNYVDDREDYVMNEVAIDYNAGFQSALAGIEHLIATNNLPTTSNRCPCHGGK